MKWIYVAFDGEHQYFRSYNPVCVDVGEIEKIELYPQDDDPDWYPTVFTVHADGMLCDSSFKPEVGRVWGCVGFSTEEYLNPQKEIDKVIDKHGKYPKNGAKVNMRGVYGWEDHETVCSDPRIMYIFNVLTDAFLATRKFSEYYVRNPDKSGPMVIPVKVEHPIAPISKQQEDAIREAVVSTIPDWDSSVAYLKRFGYPYGKQKMSMQESSIRASLVMAPLSEEKVEFLLSLIK